MQKHLRLSAKIISIILSILGIIAIYDSGTKKHEVGPLKPKVLLLKSGINEFYRPLNHTHSHDRFISIDSARLNKNLDQIKYKYENDSLWEQASLEDGIVKIQLEYVRPRVNKNDSVIFIMLPDIGTNRVLASYHENHCDAENISHSILFYFGCALILISFLLTLYTWTRKN